MSCAGSPVAGSGNCSSTTRAAPRSSSISTRTRRLPTATSKHDPKAPLVADLARRNSLNGGWGWRCAVMTRFGGLASAQCPEIRAMSVASKICGLSSEEAVAAAVEGGAAYVGFVFYPPSPRAINPERAAALCALAPPGVQRVGLFVDAEDAVIRAVLDAAPIDILQFHGGE